MSFFWMKWATAMFVLMSFSGCVDRGKPMTKSVTFIVPDGFRGVISIREDDRGVSPILDAGRNTYIYEVPNDGILVTSDISPLRDWRTYKAEFVQGTEIPVEGDSDEIALRSLSTDSDGVTLLLIGTDEDKQAYWKDRKVWNAIE